MSLSRPHAATAAVLALLLGVTVAAGAKEYTGRFRLKLGGDGKPGPGDTLAWERSLSVLDKEDFSRGTGAWQVCEGATENVRIDSGEFFSRGLARRELVSFSRPEEVGDFTLEMDIWLGGQGGHANGAPVVIVSREKRDKPHPHTAFRAAQINTYGKGGQIIDETWRGVGNAMPYRGDAAKEIVGEEWIHLKVACRGDEITMYLNDWPVHRLAEGRLAQRWLSIQNGYDEVMRVDNIVLRSRK